VDIAPAPNEPPQGIIRSLTKLWAFKSVRYASLGAAFNAFVGYGVLNFMPSFLSRVHGLDSGDIGTFLSLGVGIGGAGGAYLGGYLSDKLGKRDKRWYVWVPGIGTLASAPFFSLAVLIENLTVVWILYFIATIFLSMFLAPLIAAVHAVVGPSSRSLVSALVYFVLNIIGLGFGPVAVGMASDLLQPTFGNESLRWAMLGAAQVAILGSWFCWLSGRYLPADLDGYSRSSVTAG
jgi:MFS family permease